MQQLIFAQLLTSDLVLEIYNQFQIGASSIKRKFVMIFQTATAGQKQMYILLHKAIDIIKNSSNRIDHTCIELVEFHFT